MIQRPIGGMVLAFKLSVSNTMPPQLSQDLMGSLQKLDSYVPLLSALTYFHLRFTAPYEVYNGLSEIGFALNFISLHTQNGQAITLENMKSQSLPAMPHVALEAGAEADAGVLAGILDNAQTAFLFTARLAQQQSYINTYDLLLTAPYRISNYRNALSVLSIDDYLELPGETVAAKDKLEYLAFIYSLLGMELALDHSSPEATLHSLTQGLNNLKTYLDTHLTEMTVEITMLCNGTGLHTLMPDIAQARGITRQTTPPDS